MLVVTPTRELAMQIQEVCQAIARTRGLRVANVVGGVKLEPQIDRLARGVDVLIATPGRLIDLMNQKAVDLSRGSSARAGRGRPHARHGLSAPR